MKQATPGMRMKYSRKKEKMKLSELADKINVPIFILKSYETDRKELPYELARHIATVLHTTAGYLLGWEADPFLAEVYEQKTNEEALFDEDFDDDEPFSDEDDWDDENESISLFYEMMYKSEEEKDEILETRAFNTHIAGYLICTLQKLGCSASTITKARQLLYDEIFPNLTAEAARELGAAAELKQPDTLNENPNIIHFPTED